MRRVIEPLSRMGVSFLARSGGRLPLALTGRTDLLPIVYESPVASAQVKSAVLLAGLHAPGGTTVVEPLASRDHTERMLAAMGAELAGRDRRRRWPARHDHAASPSCAPQSFVVPGDPSSAGFPDRRRGRRRRARRSGCRASASTRCAPASTPRLREMGADDHDRERARGRRRAGGRSRDPRRALPGVEVPAERAPAMIDEYPILAVAAAFARGTTVMRGLGELRVKESDRLAAMAARPRRLRRHGSRSRATT